MFRRVHNTRQLVIAIIFFFFIGLCTAQEYIVDVQEFGVEDGLLHRNVLSVFEDTDGFIWVGTSQGVQRYDGHQFKSWTKQSATGKIFEITTIGQDNGGWLWLWNNDLREFVFLHPQTEEIQTAAERFGDDYPIYRKSDRNGWNNSSSYLLTDSAGRLCFVSSQPNQLIFFDIEKGFEFVPIQGLEADFFDLEFIDSKGQFWVQQREERIKLHVISSKGKILESYDYSEAISLDCFSEHGGEVYYQVTKKDHIGNVKIGKEGGRKSFFFKPYAAESIGVLAQEGLFWDLEPNGWDIYSDIGSRPIIHIDRKDYSKKCFELLTHFYQDKRGRVWLMGRWGLARIKLNKNLFRRYFHFNELETKPINNSSRGIFVDDDFVFANFEFGGLVRMDKNKPTDWSLIDKNEESTLYYGRPLIKINEGSLLTGHPNNIRNIQVSNYSVQSLKIDSAYTQVKHYFWSLLESRDTVWGGVNSALVYWVKDMTELEYVDIWTDEIKKEPIRNEIYQISKQKEGLLWLCSSNGFYLFDINRKKVIEKYTSTQKGKYYLPADVFYFLHIDVDGIYWLGTNEGLLRWNKSTNEKKLFTTIDGLSNNVIYAIFEDKHQHLWLSSDFGIIQFDKESFQAKAYLSKHGITHYEFNKTAAFQEENGTIYFGGLNGITAFDPGDFYKQQEEAPFKMLISDYEIFDGSKEELFDKTGELRETNTIVFQPNDRFFRLKFTLPIMEDVQRITYAWKIDGVDEQWNYQKTNTIQIGKLPYGNHQLHIKGQSSGGQWSPKPLLINVNVIRPIYLRTWFFALMFVFLVAVFWMYNKYRVYKFAKSKRELEQTIKEATLQIREDKQTIETQADELRQLDEVKSRFFANVSHELRTPLTLILGPLTTILKKENLEEKDAKLLKTARKSSNDLLKLVGSILDLSKMEAGKIELQENNANLFELVRRVSSAFESHAQRMGIQFMFTYHAEKDLQIWIDEDKLEVILNNLLSNALKFTGKNGSLEVKVIVLENNIEILIKDSGKGIHKDDLPYVFDRFYQSKQPSAHTDGGTGIGLALSQEFAKLMGGKLSVTSEWGKGSVFSFIFPKVKTNPISVVQKTHSITTTIDKNIPQLNRNIKPGEKLKILVVEDNYSLRKYVEEILLEYYQVVTAENGKQALEILLGNQVDLVLSDIMMPVMDGYQLLEELKNDNRYRHLPIVMLTARADIQDKLKALRIGVDDYLLKPFNEEELLARIQNLLSNYKNRVSSPENTSKTSKKTFSEEDHLWLDKCEQLLHSKVGEHQYSITQLAFQMAMSESTLARQLKRLTGLTPARYFQELRLNQARLFLESKQYKTIAQVAFNVGFTDPGAFSKSFKKRFGKPPVEYLNQ